MRHKGRTMFAALVAVLALGVVASASASAALPEFALAKGESFPVTLAGSSSTMKNSFQTESGVEWAGTCSGLKSKGEITGAKALSFTTEFEHCASPSGGGEECTTTGAEYGTEVMSGTGSLVYIKKSTKQVGVLLTLNQMAITCGSFKEKIRGTLLFPITPINTKTTKLGASIHANGNGGQEFTSYENEKGEVVKGQHPEINVGSGFILCGLQLGEELSLTASKSLTLDA